MRRDVLQGFADPPRRAILSHIDMEEKTPNMLAQHFDSSRQAVSKRIKILTECGRLKQEHSGREIYHFINSKKLKEVGKRLQPFRAMWEDRFNQLHCIKKPKKTKNHEPKT